MSGHNKRLPLSKLFLSTSIHCSSCRLSIEAVGSSINNMEGFVSSNRVNATSCF